MSTLAWVGLAVLGCAYVMAQGFLSLWLLTAPDVWPFARRLGVQVGWILGWSFGAAWFFSGKGL